jgi:hypothetical protein
MLRAGRTRAAILAAGALIAVAPLAACIPQDRGEAAEVDEGGAGPAGPPAFPDTGPIPAELLVEGLVYDFTSAPSDLNLWVPPPDQARCAAERIVTTLGAPRMSELGFRPGTSGASLNDIDLTQFERTLVTEEFSACVDLGTAVGSLLMGDGHLTGEQAACIADGLDERGLVVPFAESWAFGQGVDPFDGNGELASAMLAFSDVCLPDNAFTWYDAELPGDDEIQGTAEAGAPSTTVAGRPDGLSSRTGSATSTPGDTSDGP